MTDDNVTHLPDLSVVLDLDSEERPESEKRPPYIVKVGGKSITLADPEEVEWRDLATIDTPGDLLRVVMSKEDIKTLKDAKLPGWKFNRLISSYYDHYDLEEKIRDAKRQNSLGI